MDFRFLLLLVLLSSVVHAATDTPVIVEPSVSVEAPVTVEASEAEVDPHEKLFRESRFPSASTCKTCHQRHYREWSVSQHAYAQLSPVYMAMQNTLNREQSGTLGDFCIRCHTPIGMQKKESISTSNLTCDLPPLQ